MSGRTLLALLLGGLLLLVGLLFFFQGASAWRLWNIPTMSPSFADIRSILYGVQASASGYDPLYANPLDPFGRVMAYPRIWLLLGVFHLTPDNTILLAAIEGALFFAGLFLFVDRLERATALMIGAAVISPAAMLCFERGNTDLVAFFLLACALAIPAIGITISLIEFAALLKLYPVAALGVLLNQSKSRLVLWLSVGLAIFGIYAALTWRDIAQILSVASKGVGFSYGAAVLGVWVLDSTASRLLANTAFLASYLGSVALLLYILSRSHADGAVVSSSTTRILDAFRVGALIYVGTFLQGNTWNYRLIFLIFSLPALIEWSRSENTTPRRLARMALILLMLSLWVPLFGATEPPTMTFLGMLPIALAQLANWGLFATLTYLLFASLPAWARREIALFFDKYAQPARAAAKGL